MSHYKFDLDRPGNKTTCLVTPVIGDLISIEGRGTFVCCGSSDAPHGYCTADQCCFYCGGCLVAGNIACVGIHWFTPVEDSL